MHSLPDGGVLVPGIPREWYTPGYGCPSLTREGEQVIREVLKRLGSSDVLRERDAQALRLLARCL